MKHYLVIYTTVFDCEESRSIHSCMELATAQRFYNEHLEEARKITEDESWEVQSDRGLYYCACEEGYYALNHVEIEVLEMEMV